MEIDLLFFLAVVPAIILYGIAKSGLGGSISLISVPLMTLVMPLTQALAIILPILIFSDMVAVYRFRKEFDFSTLKLIVPSAAVGIIIGSITVGLWKKSIFDEVFSSSLKSIFIIIISAFLMGYSARLAFGCNIGALFGGIASGSVHGWVWFLFAFIGSYYGVKSRKFFY